MNRIGAILGGLGVGALLMYLLDPNRGNRRRAMIRDKALSLSHKTQRAVSGRAKDLRNRASGLVHETKSLVTGGSNRETEDQTILHEGPRAS